MQAKKYDKYDYKEMINNCKHLPNEQKQLLFKILGNYKEFFSGKLGKISGPSLEIKLKRHVKPFQFKESKGN